MAKMEKMEKKCGYAGQISHTGAQVVKAPFGNTKQGKATVKTGDDLRTGK